METKVDTESEVGVATLVKGIVGDARALLVEQMTLFQVEMKKDVRRTTAALAPLIGGMAVLLVGLILLGIGGASFLSWIVPEIPVWIAYTVAGWFFVVAGGALVLWGKTLLDQVDSTPVTALKGLKENIQWKMKK